MEIHSYEPLPKQQEFHSSPAKNRFFVGGFGSGKTRALVWESIDLCMKYPNNCGLIARKYNEDIHETVYKTFYEECPKEFISSTVKGGYIVNFVNGSQIIFSGLYTKQKARITKVGSYNLGFFGLDEAHEFSEEDYLMMQGRLRLDRVPKHYAVIVTNPPNIDHWIYRKTVLDKNPDTCLIQTSSFDNPYLPKEYLENLLKEYPETWVKRYIYGQFGFLTPGYSVYSGFLEDKHIGEFKYNTMKPILRGWDFGWHRPCAAFCQMDSDDRFIVLKEHMGNKIYLDEYADKVIEFSNKQFPDSKFEDYCDPAGTQQSDKGTRTSIEILNSKGVYPKYRRIEEVMVRTIIQRKINTYIGDKPALLVDKNCRIIKEGFLGGYYFAKNQEGVPENKPYKDGLYEHLMDAVRYIFACLNTNNQAQDYNFEIREPKWFAGVGARI